MSSSERSHGDPNHEAEKQPYHLAARYNNERRSAQVYQEAQDFLYENAQLELSAYRLQLRRLESVHYDWYVAVVGTELPAEFDSRFRRILAEGEIVTLPQEALDFLLQRRSEAMKLGFWVEGHYKPGKRRRLR